MTRHMQLYIDKYIPFGERTACVTWFVCLFLCEIMNVCVRALGACMRACVRARARARACVCVCVCVCVCFTPPHGQPGKCGHVFVLFCFSPLEISILLVSFDPSPIKTFTGSHAALVFTDDKRYLSIKGSKLDPLEHWDRPKIIVDSTRQNAIVPRVSGGTVSRRN